MYVIDTTWNSDQKVEFLACGDSYWWGSNRVIPINVFLGPRFRQFSASLKSFSQKEAEVVQGPMPSLDDLINKRTKKRTIQLVRAVPEGS